MLEVNNEKTAAWVDIDPFPTVSLVEIAPLSPSPKKHVKSKFQEYTYNAKMAHSILIERGVV